MTGPKLNEGALLIPEGVPTTKATAKYLRGSASKARVVLDNIRGLDVRRADEVLQFTTRDVARDVRKVLASAVANAVHNDAQDADELYVLAAYADEGPTLRRFRPRARGRASRIRKRTSHITVIVARLSDDRLEVLQNRQQASSPTARRRAGTSAQSRADRVQRSRSRAESLRDGAEVEDSGAELTDERVADEVAAGATDAGPAEDVDASEAAAAEDAAQAEADEAAAEQAEAVDAVDADAAADAVDADEPELAAAEQAEADMAELPAGAVSAPEDGSTPTGYEIKGNASSKKFHVPGGRYYDITIAELFFDSVESAEAAGYDAPAADADLVEGEDQP